MEPNQIPQAPQNPSMPPHTEFTAPPKKSGGMGPILGILIIILLLIVGALYLWGEKLSQEDGATQTQTENTGYEDAATAALSQQGSSDDLSSIRADLESTNTTNLDAGSSDIDSNINSL